MEPITDTLLSELRVPRTDKEMIMVIGVGGAGCNAVANMWRIGVHGVSYMACNTDQKSLNVCPVSCKIRLGEEGLGAGNNPERGRAAAIASLEDVRFQLTSSGCRMVFIAAGMGGGTGTGAAPVIAKLAKEMNLLTVGIVTSPLASEGELRWRQAMEAIAEMEQQVDALLVIDNDNVVNLYNDLSLEEAFGCADDVLTTATRGIAEIVSRESNLVGVDFADVSTVMRNCGRAHMSVTSACGENRAEEAIRASLCSPLLGQMQIAGAKNILINFSTSESRNLKAREMKLVLERVQQYANGGRTVSGLSPTNIIWGTSVNKEMEPGTLELVLVATGFDVKASCPPPIPPLPENPAGRGAARRQADAEKTGPEAKQAGKAADAAFGEPSAESGTGEMSVSIWEQLSRQVTQFVTKILEGPGDTPLE